MCSHYTLFSRLQNLYHRFKRKYRRRAEWEREAILNNVAFDSVTGRPKEARNMHRLFNGRTLCCVWEKQLKPFAVKMIKITGVKGGGMSGGLAEVTLENGITFRGTEARTRHIYQDKGRLTGALEAPTRANVLIFTHGYEAAKYLKQKGCERLCQDIDFTVTEESEKDGNAK